MAEEIKCPVCGKAGINNYHNEDVICPCCGSDLSIFRVIDSVPDKKSTSSLLWKIISGTACALAIGLAVVCINYNNDLKENQEQLTLACESIKAKDSKIEGLEKDLEQSKDKNLPTSFHKHIVLKGDSFWKISCRYYGTGTRYKEIAQWNNLSINAHITPGDTILIK